MSANAPSSGKKIILGLVAALGAILLVVAGIAIGLNLNSQDSPGKKFGPGMERPEKAPSSEPRSTEGARSPVGEWAGDLKDAKPGTVTLTLTSDGGVRANDGCNQGSGRFILDGDEAKIRGLVSTMRGCPDLKPWLMEAKTAVVSDDGKTIDIFNIDGDKIGTLERQSSAIGKPKGDSDTGGGGVDTGDRKPREKSTADLKAGKMQSNLGVGDMRSNMGAGDMRSNLGTTLS